MFLEILEVVVTYFSIVFSSSLLHYSVYTVVAALSGHGGFVKTVMDNAEIFVKA